MKGELVVVTRSKPGSEEWMHYLRRHGAKPYYFPTITIRPVKPTPTIAKVLSAISSFDWVVFTSAAAPRALEKLLRQTGVYVSRRELPLFAAIGDRTAEAARDSGYKISFKPIKTNSESLARGLKSVRGRSILLLRTTIASNGLVEALTKRGGKVTDMPIYETKLIRRKSAVFSKMLKQKKVGYVIFGSPSAVEGFFARIPRKLFPEVRKLAAISIGPKVAESLKRAGFKKIYKSKQPTIEAIVAAIPKYKL